MCVGVYCVKGVVCDFNFTCFCGSDWHDILICKFSGMQNPSIWGSKLWAVLHAVGIRTGRSLPSMSRDEVRELQWIVNNLETIVSCQECRKHIQEYRRHVPSPDKKAGDYHFWFWNFHEAVNSRLGKIGLPFESVSEVHKKGVFEAWREFEMTVKGKVSLVVLKTFERHLRLWAGFAGI